jgi:hypothetical protein
VLVLAALERLAVDDHFRPQVLAVQSEQIFPNPCARETLPKG